MLTLSVLTILFVLVTKLCRSMPPTLPFMSSLGQSAASSAASSGGASFGSFLGNLLFGPFNSALQWSYQKRQMALQQKYALAQMAKSAQYQLDHDKQMFDYENAYNEPSKVFDRYLKAGVTPAGVLGSTGVGVSATIPTGSGGSPSASIPSGSSSLGSPVGFSGDPRAIAANMLSDSERQRNISAANRDDAEADRLRGDTHSKQWRLDMDELSKSLAEANVEGAQAYNRILAAQGRIMDNDAELSDVTYGYRLEKIITETALLKEDYNQIHKYNVKYMDSLLSSSIILNYARIFEADANAGLAQAQSELVNINARDAREWFKVNWETPISVPRYNDKGQIAYVERYTGAEIHSTLLALQISQADLERGMSRWSLRSDKNKLGYDMLRALCSGLGFAAMTAATKGKNLGSLTNTVVTTSGERYGPNGEFQGMDYRNTTTVSSTRPRHK